MSSQSPGAPSPAAPSRIIHEILSVGMLHCNCHIVGDTATREGIVIDPGDNAAAIVEAIERHGLTIRAIVVTHTHIDHVGALRHLQRATGAPVRMHPDDLELYAMLDMQAAWLGCAIPEKANVDELLREGDSLRYGTFEAQVMHTPGHTLGSVCLYVPAHAAGAAEPGMLFSGDTLFAGSIGRTDLWGGSLRTIKSSLQDKLLRLPDATIVYPGHGEATTIGAERASNPFLAGSFLAGPFPAGPVPAG